MKKRILSLVLALVMCLGLVLPALAAETNLPDWYFLFAIFKNLDADVVDGYDKTQHATYSMPREEVDLIRDLAEEFEAYMNSVGVMRTHVEVVEIDETVTEVGNSDEGSSYFGPELAAPFLEGKVDMDRYDYVFCILDLTVWTGYAGMSFTPPFENGTGMSHIQYRNWEHLQNNYNTFTDQNLWHVRTYVHEFLHFGEKSSKKWGGEYKLHDIIENDFYAQCQDQWKACFTDIILNRAKGADGTGVSPAVWHYPPRVLRTMTELNVPSGTASIGEWAFANNTALKKVTIAGSVAEIGTCAFQNCTGLSEVTVRPGVTAIGDWAFGCNKTRSALTKVTIPASVTSVGYAAFWNTSIKDVYYSGTQAQWKAIQIGDYNGDLTKATIHYNSIGIPAAAAPTNDKLTCNGAAQNPTVYKIGDSNYFKIRDLAAILNGTEKQFAVGYDGSKNAVTATTGQGYAKQSGDLAGAPSGGAKSASLSNDVIYINGSKIDVEVYKIDGSNYFKLRDLGKALNFYVGWSREQGMYIETNRPYSG